MMKPILWRLHSTSTQSARLRRGSVLVEFALVSFALYLLMVVLLDFGRASLATQTLQSAADLLARELATAPISGTLTFEEALEEPYVKQRVFDESLLVIELGSGLQTPEELDAYFATLPVVNQVLRPLMFRETIPALGLEVLRYPGALVSSGGSDLTVLVPRVLERDRSGSPGGVETLDWLRVVEEVKESPGAPSHFPINSQSEFRGIVNVRLNYPYQAAAMSAFDPSAERTGPSSIVLASDAEVSAGELPDGFTLALDSDPGDTGPYSGRYGLGAHYAFLNDGRRVRPYRRLLAIQAVARREVVFVPN